MQSRDEDELHSAVEPDTPVGDLPPGATDDEDWIPPRRRRQLNRLGCGLALTGLLFLLILLAIGDLAHFKFLGPKRTASQRAYWEQRDAPGTNLPPMITRSLSALASSGPSSPADLCDPVASLREIAAVKANLSVERFVREAEQTGDSSIAKHNRGYWVRQLQASDHRFQDLVADESRLIASWPVGSGGEHCGLVAQYRSTWPTHRLQLIYFAQERISRDQIVWQVYDWRDVLVPTSAAYLLAKESWRTPGTVPLHQLTDSLLSIAELSDLNGRTQGELTVELSRELHLEEGLEPLAVSRIGWQVVDFGQFPLLNSFLHQHAAVSSLEVQLLTAVEALHRGDNLAATTQCHRLMQTLPWHPLVAIIAFDAAESESQLNQAKTLLTTSLSIFPGDEAAASRLLPLAGDRELLAVVGRWRDMPDRASRWEQLHGLSLKFAPDLTAQINALAASENKAKPPPVPAATDLEN